MLILTTALTSGQITFVFRVIIQLLSYGGIFLIGLIILGNSPRTAFKETHDVLNRVVGKSTTTLTTTKWILKRIFKRSGDTLPSKRLLFALLLFMIYGLFALLSDIGFLGLKDCTVPYPSFDTFPASIQTEADARALVVKNMINGTDPKSIKFHQCGSAREVVIDVNVTEQICSQWHNTTYDDPTLFRSLNLTDSDVLMHKNLGAVNTTTSDGFDLNNYYVGTSDRIVLANTTLDGLAILPHSTGVSVVIGAPTLSKNQAVTMSKTMAVEVEIGCLSIGVIGQQAASTSGSGYDWFLPDSFYKPIQRSQYSGQDNLFSPLQTAANTVRALIRPAFNASIVDITSGAYIRSNNHSTASFTTFQTLVDSWLPSNGTFDTDTPFAILANCTAQVHQVLNVSNPSDPVRQPAKACGFYQLSGSWADDGVGFLGYSPMICASSTAVNMVSTNLEMDSDGHISGQITRLSSDLNIVNADYFEVIQTGNDTTWANFDKIQRFTLTDNPGGGLQHYIYQQYASGLVALLSQGTGSPGYVISQVGGAMVDASSFRNLPTTLIVDDSMFGLARLNDSAVSIVTKWAGGFGASYFLQSLSMNGFAALDKPRITIESTGGRAAVCYKTPYVAGFVPLIVAALVVLLWTLQMLVSSQLRETDKWEKLYGGLVPTKSVDGTGPQAVLVWDENAQLGPLKGDDSM